RDAGRTLVVTTQVVGEAAYCDKVAVLSSGRLIALAPPDGLRRMASGGDVIQIRTSAAFHASTLEDLPDVRESQPRPPRGVLVIANTAAPATPRVVGAVAAAGGTVESSSEYRPTFDEVFAALVARAEGDNAERNETHDEQENRDRSVARAA